MMDDLTPDEVAALAALLPEPTGDLSEDLAAAAKVAMQRRVDNSRLGGAVLAALHRQLHSWREVERVTGIPHATARRWATPPPGS